MRPPLTASNVPHEPAGPGTATSTRRPRSYRWAALLLAVALGVGIGWIIYQRFARPPAQPVPAAVWPVTVSTIAGSGTPGRADGFVSAALFSDPFGVAVDAGGNTYVTDAGDNNMVRRIAPTGEVTTVAGGTEGWRDATGGEAQFNTPSGIAVSPDGTLVVADTGNNAIRRVTPGGVVTTVAGGAGRGRQDGPAITAMFDAPLGVAVGADGTIFVADTYNDCIRRISTDGTVTTVAGGLQTGYRDGTGGEARFDTPSGIAIDTRGVLYVADSGNNVIRKVDRYGAVSTVGETGSTGGGAGVALWRPVGVAIGEAGHLYVSDSLGRVCLFSADGTSRVIAGGTAGFADGPGTEARFSSPSGLAVEGAGAVRVADSENYLVRALTPPGKPRPSRDVFLSPLPLLSPAALGFQHVPWPVDPQEGWHEVTATLGEARGSFGGDGRERLHAGIDVHADPGTVVRAVHDEKVTRPIAATGYGELNEMVRVALVSYVHVKAGRDAKDVSLDPSRFTVLYDDNGLATRVRVRRGTTFRRGDAVGTVNRFAHVHLGLGPHAGEVNLLRFSLAQFTDRVKPTIPARGISLVDEWGTPFRARKGRLEVTGRVQIVAEAWDQVDRNERRRRLGVYSLGYQVIAANGKPADGFDQPRMTMEFDRLPQTQGAAGLAFAQGSGITVYGNRVTRFRYVVTNEVRGGEAKPGWWETNDLPPGEYRVRVIARDIAGNTATRDVPVRIVRP